MWDAYPYRNLGTGKRTEQLRVQSLHLPLKQTGKVEEPKCLGQYGRECFIFL